jgi:hypothetical protein
MPFRNLRSGEQLLYPLTCIQHWRSEVFEVNRVFTNSRYFYAVCTWNCPWHVAVPICTDVINERHPFFFRNPAFSGRDYE